MITLYIPYIYPYIKYIYIYNIYIHTYNSLAENSLIFMTAKKFINLLYSFEAPAIVYKRLKKLTSFNNATLNKIIKKTLAS